MTDEEIIRELKSVEEQYRNKPVPTFEVSVSLMARSCRQHIEQLAKENEELNRDKTELVNSVTELETKVTELEKQIEKMECCGNCKHYKQTDNYLVGTCKEKWNIEGNNICNEWELR